MPHYVLKTNKYKYYYKQLVLEKGARFEDKVNKELEDIRSDMKIADVTYNFLEDFVEIHIIYFKHTFN